ncbi:DNA polymerase III subunit alpha [Candidatus Symbiothrix dinenymphae]|nr:DNA polymerase III subunit alpha [Candidatus Symbiothrix dinenymphae]
MSATSNFVHLHVHSHYSQLDGMSTIPGLVDKALQCGMRALALTDHGNMYGAKEFYDYVNKKNKDKADDEKIKPILGVEAYCAYSTRFEKTVDNKRDYSRGWHLILLAKNKQGYKNLCKLVSTSWIDGNYYHPRIDKDCLKEFSEGLIVSSACLGGEIPRKIQADDMQGAEEAILWFKSVFGDDFYLEIQRHKTDAPGGDQEVYQKQMRVNKAILELAAKTNTKIICTNDVHFVEEDHAEAHDRLICLGTGKNLDDPKRLHYTKQEWFKSADEMAAIFSDLPETLLNTLEVADKVETYSIDSAPLMPAFAIPEEFGTEEQYRQKFTEDDLRAEFNKEDAKRFDTLGGYDKVVRIKLEADYLRDLTLKKAPARYGDPIPADILERIEFELDTMKTMGFPGYFLIVQDFIQAARDMGVSVGPGRGSAAGSVVAYCLKITDIDPLKYDLLFERFLNPDRISLPDIDIDFDDDGRKSVLRWVTEKYGKKNVANIVTYGTMATKSAIKDVARVQGVSIPEADRLVKLIPDHINAKDKNGKELKVNIKNSIAHVPELQEARHSTNRTISDVLKYAEQLEGTVRQTGVHACGVIIGADDLTNYVPLATAKEKGTDEDLLVTQYEGGTVESVGLIKMDFLGLKTLSIIKEALSNIKKSKGIDLDIDAIPIDDKKTYELYSQGKTIGTFQFESPGMQKYLRELQPSKFEDLIAMNALYRPGPMAYIPDFIDRKHGRKPISYDFPEMEGRLKDTYGITVYQEQVMLLSRDLADFTRGQSDELRKAMGKKLVDKMATLKTKFIDGATKKGFSADKLEKIWSDWAEFAKYAFNKSHATCYSWIAYQTAYLKAHYPAEFLAANLTRNLDNIYEVTKFMDECRAMGTKVLGPDVNESDLNFVVNKRGDIRFGLGGIKGVGRTAVDAIVRERDANGAFTSIFDFVERINQQSCNKRIIEALCLAGAFDNFPDFTREQIFAENTKGEAFSDTLINYGNKFQTDKNSSTNSLFGGIDAVEIARPPIPQCEPWSTLERLNKEKEYVGIYLSSHPLDDYYIALNYLCSMKMANFAEAKDNLPLNQEITMGGIVTGFREGTTKTGNPYGVLKMEDFSGSGEVALFGKAFLAYRNYGVKGTSLLIRGSFQTPQWGDPTRINFQIRSIEPLSGMKSNTVNNLTITIPLSKLDDELMAELTALLKENRGSSSLYFKIEDTESNLSLSLASSQGKYLVDKDIVRYLEDHEVVFAID